MLKISNYYGNHMISDLQIKLIFYYYFKIVNNYYFILNFNYLLNFYHHILNQWPIHQKQVIFQIFLIEYPKNLIFKIINLILFVFLLYINNYVTIIIMQQAYLQDLIKKFIKKNLLHPFQGFFRKFRNIYYNLLAILFNLFETLHFFYSSKAICRISSIIYKFNIILKYF